MNGAYYNRQLRQKGDEVYLCLNCMDFDGRFYFKLEKGSDVYEPRYLCSTCRKKLVKVTFIEKKGHYKIVSRDMKNVEWKCRVCGSNKLVKD